MKNWLIQKEEEQKNLFKDLISMSIQILKEFNEQEKMDISIRIIFDKDNWINGKATLEILETNGEEYNIRGEYNHSIYNSNQDLSKKSPLFELMEQGLFTNTRFSILDSSRVYNATFILTDKDCVLENNECEYLENRYKETHFGFNISPTQSNKNKIKK